MRLRWRWPAEPITLSSTFGRWVGGRDDPELDAQTGLVELCTYGPSESLRYRHVQSRGEPLSGLHPFDEQLR